MVDASDMGDEVARAFKRPHVTRRHGADDRSVNGTDGGIR